MKIYQINEKIIVKASLDEVWEFFSNPPAFKIVVSQVEE